MERTRTIGRIKQSIIDNATENIPGLSTSNAAEWKLWASIVATAIHAFELIMELFAKEIDALTTRITPGTIRWYAEMCKRFQNGDTLAFDTETALLYYPKKDPAKQIIAVAAVSEKQDTAGAVSIKVAKKDAQGHIVELSPSELYNFKNYIDSIKFAGSRTEVNSTKADLIYYDLTVYHDTTKSSEEISGDITKALEQFKVSIDFDGVLYRQKLLDAVMDVAGVTTCALNALEQHTYKDQDPSVWHSVDTHTPCWNPAISIGPTIRNRSRRNRRTRNRRNRRTRNSRNPKTQSRKNLKRRKAPKRLKRLRRHSLTKKTRKRTAMLRNRLPIFRKTCSRYRNSAKRKHRNRKRLRKKSVG